MPSDLFLDTRGLSAALAQVVELRASHVTAALDLDLGDRRAVRLKHPLDALAVRDLAHGERRVQAAIALRDHDALVGLQPLAIALGDSHLHDDGITRSEVRNIGFQLLALDLVNHIRHRQILYLSNRPLSTRDLPRGGTDLVPEFL